jgi:Tfp pilus assembly protein PilF
VIENAQKDATTPSAMATIADKNFAQSPEKQSPKISYLKGVESVERLFNQKKYADALIQIAPLLSEYPNQTKLWIMQGTLYKKIGEKRLAYQAFKKAGTLDPNNVQVQRASDLLQSEIGEVAE